MQVASLHADRNINDKYAHVLSLRNAPGSICVKLTTLFGITDYNEDYTISFDFIHFSGKF